MFFKINWVPDIASTQVVIFEVRNGAGKSRSIVLLAAWNRAYAVTSLVVDKDTIILTDAIRSLSKLRWSNKKLETVAQDLSPLWPLSMGILSEQDVIVGEVSR